MFAIAISGVFVLLSQWQFGRSTQAEAPVSTTTEETRQLTSVLQPGGFFPGSVADQMVSATGSYDPQKQVLVPGRLNDGAKGYWIVSAFAVKDAPVLKGGGATPQTWIPVARGWVADPADAVAPPSGTIELTGRLLPSESPLPQHRSRTRPRQRRLGRRTHQRLERQQLPGLCRRDHRTGRRHRRRGLSRRRRRQTPPDRPAAARAAGQLAEPLLFRGMGGLCRLRVVHLVAARQGRLPPRPRRRARRGTGRATSPGARAATPHPQPTRTTPTCTPTAPPADPHPTAPHPTDPRVQS